MPALELIKFSRKPFDVNAIQVTEANMETVATWCGGEIKTDDDGKTYIHVPVIRPAHEKHTMAYVGNWILHSGVDSFKVFTHKALHDSFNRVTPEPKPEWAKPANEMWKLHRPAA